jgi:N-acetyl-gamma-glutamyl-phosphate reductase
MRVAVAGASGYAGGELLRLIAGHPEFKLAVATADSGAGKAVADVHPNLAGYQALASVAFEPHDPAALAAADLIFLALPAGASAAMAAAIPADVKIIDLGADHRLADSAAWARYYDGDHAGRWVTGLPELPGARARIQSAARVAAPGCYATAVILGLAPLVAAGLVRSDDIVVVAASGTSGAGRALRAELLGSEVMGSVSAYQAGGVHRHTPEIEQALGELNGERAVRVSFTPLLAPMPRGILATCSAPLSPGPAASAAASSTGPDVASLQQVLAEAYAGEPFVRLLPGGRWPSTAAVSGSNGAHLQVAADQRTGRATVVVAIDNLGKGAAGQAIQLANLMLGLPETAGLTSMGVAP